MTRGLSTATPRTWNQLDMETPSSSKRIHFDFKRALIPVSLGVFFVLHFIFAVPTWVLLILMLWIPAFYIGGPWYARRKWRAFEKEFAWRFSQQDYRGLLDLYKKQRFLRQFGPQEHMLGKLGLIYSAMGRTRDAERVLERAVKSAARNQRQQYMLNLGHVKYELGKYKEARQIYTRLLKSSPHVSRAELKLAMIGAHLGEDLNTNLALIRSELPRANSEDKARMEAALEAGERKQNPS